MIKLKLVCYTCHNIFTVIVPEHKLQKGRIPKQIYCSNKCRKERRR